MSGKRPCYCPFSQGLKYGWNAGEGGRPGGKTIYCQRSFIPMPHQTAFPSSYPPPSPQQAFSWPLRKLRRFLLTPKDAFRYPATPKASSCHVSSRPRPRVKAPGLLGRNAYPLPMFRHVSAQPGKTPTGNF